MTPFRASLALLAITAPLAIAEQFGDFTYRVNEDDTITITSYPRDAVGQVEIPAEIEGRQVTIIAALAFYQCQGITSVAIPDGVTSLHGTNGRPFPPRGAFMGCTALTTIALPPSLASIGRNVFRGCSELKAVSIPEGVISIGQNAFEGCTALTHIRIPEGVTYIGDEAFTGCTGLQAIIVDEGNPIYASEDGVLFDSDMAILIRYPEGKTGPYTIPEGVTYIDDYTFSGCTGLTSVTIPEGLTTIGWGAFSGCTGLTSVAIPASVPGIERATFHGCTGLTSVTIPGSITSIGNSAFSGCTGLTSVTIPEGVTSIGYSAFSGCTGLTSATIPGSVTTIEPSAFSGCTGLTSVTILGSVTTIEPSAFSGCTGLTSVTILANITSIGDGAFSDCVGLTAVSFLGDSPSFIGNAFDRTAPEFSIYYLSTSTGFTSPTWNGYPAVEIDVDTYPASPWLLEHGLPHDADLHQDLNHDGVSLLMAYALDLDPRQNLRGKLPVPILDGDTLRMTFRAARPGVTYTVQTSSDLQTWTSEGVTTSDPDDSGLRTATVPRDASQRFLRLVVE